MIGSAISADLGRQVCCVFCGIPYFSIFFLLERALCFRVFQASEGKREVSVKRASRKACLAFLARFALASARPKSVKKSKKGCSAGYTVSCITCVRQGTLRADREALATVTGIVDGTGSVGAAIGQVYFDTTRLFRNENWAELTFAKTSRTVTGDREKIGQ